MKDTIFNTPRKTQGPFQFDDSVAAVFPDMIQRSVPGYKTVLTGIGELTGKFVQANTQLYDLGCSLGAASLTMRRKIDKPGCKIIAVDNSKAMITRASQYINAYHSEIPIELHLADMVQTPIENASVVVINFTLQFIEPAARQGLIDKIYQGLNPGGILVLSEKVHFEETAAQQAIEHLHMQFKRANGYSELEISQKRASLDNVLVSDTAEEHLERFKKAGFTSAAPWFQAYNFMSFIAIKNA